MKQKVFTCLFFIILLNVSFSLNANERGINSNEIKSMLSFSISNNLNKIIKYDNDNTDYLKKRRGMLALGGVGVGVLAAGALMEFAGTFVFFYYYFVREPMFESIADSYGLEFVPPSWYNEKYIGLGLACAGSLLFLGGLAMTIVGFVLARYYKKKAGKIALSVFTEYENAFMKTGFVFRL